MATRLILIRHGRTSWNEQRRYCGFRNIGLSFGGRQEAKRLKKRLKVGRVDKIYTSDRKRAIQTAKIVFGNKAIEKVADLKEMHFGVFEGLTYKEVMKRYPNIYKKWMDNPYSVTMPQGESLLDFKKRVNAAFKKIVRLNRDKTVACVCHGGTISIFVTSILKTKDFWKYIPNSASMSIVEYKFGEPKIRLFNNAELYPDS